MPLRISFDLIERTWGFWSARFDLWGKKLGKYGGPGGKKRW